jgi:hypothetical protein
VRAIKLKRRLKPEPENEEEAEKEEEDAGDPEVQALLERLNAALRPSGGAVDMDFDDDYYVLVLRLPRDASAETNLKTALTEIENSKIGYEVLA